MKIKNVVLLDKEFLKVCGEVHKMDIPMKISFPLRKIVEVLEIEEKRVENMKTELYKKYGNPIFENEEIKGYEIVKDKVEDFSREFNDLCQFEFEIPIENKIEVDINDPSLKNLNISSEKIFKLELLFNFKM